MLPGGVVRRGHLVLRRGSIKAVAEKDEPLPAHDTAVDASPYLVLPGLFNAHDHLEFNCLPPCAPNRPYANAREWYADVRAEPYAPTLRDVLALPLKQRLLAGGFRNLLAGVTTAAHHNPPVRLVHTRKFPVTVPRKLGYSHSLDTDPDPSRSLPRDSGRPWVIHAAEGTGPEEAAELARLEELGCLRPGTVLVHCLGIDRDNDPARIARSGAGMVWCPSSNDFLYRAAAPVRQVRQHAVVALGTDSTISGGGEMLAELRAARQAEPELSPADILVMATEAGADLFGLGAAKGRLAAGADADLALFRLRDDRSGDPLLAPFEARHPALVLRGGIPQFGGPEFRPLMTRLGLGPVSFTMDGLEFLMPRHLFRHFAATVAATRGWPPFHGSVAPG